MRLLLDGVVHHVQLLGGVVDHGQLLEGVVDHGQLLTGVVDHGQLLELLLAKLGLYTELLLAGLGFTKREYARTCCWLGSVLHLEVGGTPRPAAGWAGDVHH